MPFNKGQAPWNKGLTKETDETVKRIAELKKGKSRPDWSHHLKRYWAEGGKPWNNGKTGIHSEETRDSIAESVRSLWKDPKYRAHQSAVKKELFQGEGNPFHGKVHSPESLQLMSAAHTEMWLNPEYQVKQREARGQSPNGLEVRFLRDNPEYDYVGDLSFFVGSKNPDFVLPSTNKCVDLFGDYWHEGEDPTERIRYFKERGYELTVIWEHELNDLTDTEIANKVSRWLVENNKELKVKG